MRGRTLATALVALTLGAGAPPAAAQQDEVFVDPDSPTGREYDIPLERARRDAGQRPEIADAPYRSRSAPLFGVGVGDAAAAAPEAGAARERPPRRGAAARAVEAAVVRPGAPEGGAGSALPVAGAGLLVLALGAAGGLALRRARG